MFIVGSLLAGWILKLFGFNAVVTAGMLQIFGVTIDTLGYYFLFASLGAMRSVANTFGKGIEFNWDWNKVKAKAKENKNK